MICDWTHSPFEAFLAALWAAQWPLNQSWYGTGVGSSFTFNNGERGSVESCS